jgi:poly(ADP-ribose) glycohydrolase ARH3
MLRDRVRGCILGSVIGDAFGAPLEGATPSGIAPIIEHRSTTASHWGYTDDSAMLLACCEALTSAGTVEPASLLRALANCYEPARGFGHGMKMALAAFSSGTQWDRCAFVAWPDGSRGNGGAVRIPPIAVARWNNAQTLDIAVRLATRTTHAHADAVAFARLHAVAIAIVLSEPSSVEVPSEFHKAILARLSPVPQLVTSKLSVVFELLRGDATPTRAAQTLGTSTLAAESVPVALWSFLSRHGSFTEALCSAALLGGDVDSICCLVGALAGALHGASGVKDLWIHNLSHEKPSPSEILAMADGVYDLVPSPPTAAA